MKYAEIKEKTAVELAALGRLPSHAQLVIADRVH